MSTTRQIKVGAILSYLSIAPNIVAGLIYTPWMVRQIGQGDYGLYTLANSLITLFLVDFGLGSAVSRYIAKYRAENRQDKIDNFLGVVFKLYLIIDAVIVVALTIVYFLLDKIYINMPREELERFRVIYIMAASFAVVNFPCVSFNGILNAYEKFIQMKLADVMYRVLLVALTVLALFLGHGVYALVAVHAIVGLLIIIYKFIVIKRQLPVKANIHFRDRSLYVDLFGFSIWTTVAALSQRLVFSITPSILGVVASSTAIAVFGIVATIEGYTYTVTGALNGMFMPRVARIYSSDRATEQVFPLLLGVGKFQFAVNGLIIAGFAVIGKDFIRLWMGPGYEQAYYGILLVTIPGLFYNSLEVANTAMVVQKKVKVQAEIGMGVGLINVILSFWLSGRWGVVGACWSIFAAYSFRAIAYLAVIWKKMKLDIPRFVMKCYVAMGIPIIAAIILTSLLITKEIDGWAMLIMKGAVVTVVYAVMVFAVGLDAGERAACLRLLRNRIRRADEKG